MVLPLLRRAFLGIIALVLLSVPVLGFTYLLPHLFGGLPLALHVGLSCLLCINICFNFIAAVARHPGRLPACWKNIHLLSLWHTTHNLQ